MNDKLFWNFAGGGFLAGLLLPAVVAGFTWGVVFVAAVVVTLLLTYNYLQRGTRVQ